MLMAGVINVHKISVDTFEFKGLDGKDTRPGKKRKNRLCV